MYGGTTTDVKIRTEDYNKLTSSNGMVCVPKLKNGKVYSFQEVDCSVHVLNMTALMQMLIGQPYAVNLKFGEENGKTYVEYSDSTTTLKLYKVSNSTSLEGGINSALIIIIVVVVIIIIVVIVILLVLASKKKQKTKKLPTKTVSNKPN